MAMETFPLNIRLCDIHGRNLQKALCDWLKNGIRKDKVYRKLTGFTKLFTHTLGQLGASDNYIHVPNSKQSIRN